MTDANSLDLDEARAWLEQYCAEKDRSQRHLERRWAEIKIAVADTGTYVQTSRELEWGARVAWRQSVRCIGRARWQSLVVRDARAVRGAAGVADWLTDHLDVATNGGQVRSVITVFAPDGPDGAPVRIRNDQLVRYAGYPSADGTVLGDPARVELTDEIMRHGWTPPVQRTRFDVLPWLIEDADGAHVVPVPAGSVLEVVITHPDLAWFAELGLRWYAVPAMSTMRLRIGGIDYGCAPFNGWYLVDEIATRNLGDPDRYDQLPVVAARMGLSTRSRTNFWQLRALVELNTAVLHSFRSAGVKIEEPVAESELFARFVAREEALGRTVHGDWSWLNGHLGSHLGAAWHRYYGDGEPDPTFHPPGTTGGCPHHA